jgi:hypothetical protein
MNIITLLKLLVDSGAVSPKAPTTPPSSEAGLRPKCGIGEEAVYDPIDDSWRCQIKFK